MIKKNLDFRQKPYFQRSGNIYLLQDTPCEAALSLDRIRCASKAAGGFFNILETEAGAYRYFDGYYQGTGEGGVREKKHWQSVMHGARMILLWKYRGRISDKQTDEYNLMAWDGSITERAKMNAKVAGELQELAEILNQRAIRAKTAVFTPRASRKYVELDDGSLAVKDLLHDSIAGAYQIFWDRNVATDILCEEDMTLENLMRYKLILLPFAVVIPKKSAAVLSEYVRNGGTIFADSGSGMQTEECRNCLHAPGYGLTEVFGVYYNDILSRAAAPAEKILKNGLVLPVSYGYSILHPSSAEVYAFYASGTPAIAMNSFGKGKAFFLRS